MDVRADVRTIFSEPKFIECIMVTKFSHPWCSAARERAPLSPIISCKLVELHGIQQFKRERERKVINMSESNLSFSFLACVHAQINAPNVHHWNTVISTEPMVYITKFDIGPLF